MILTRNNLLIIVFLLLVLVLVGVVAYANEMGARTQGNTTTSDYSSCGQYSLAMISNSVKGDQIFTDWYGCQKLSFTLAGQVQGVDSKGQQEGGTFATNVGVIQLGQGQEITVVVTIEPAIINETIQDVVIYAVNPQSPSVVLTNITTVQVNEILDPATR
jgi:hypothetical protein